MRGSEAGKGDEFYWLEERGTVHSAGRFPVEGRVLPPEHHRLLPGVEHAEEGGEADEADHQAEPEPGHVCLEPGGVWGEVHQACGQEGLWG